MCQDEPDQQRFLFAGRGIRRSDPFGGIDDFEIGQMRAVERASGGGVAGPVVAQHCPIALLDLARGMRRKKPFHPAVERDLRRRKSGAFAACQHGFETMHGLGAQAGDGDGKLCRLVLDGVEPVRVGPRLFQEPVARAQRAVERVDAAAMFGIDCHSGDTFTDGTVNVAMTSMHVPEPVISLTVNPKDNKGQTNMSKALRRFTKEDPTFRVSADPETGETIIAGMGELHLDVYVERMKREYAAEVVTSTG